MAYETILTSLDDGVLTLTLNRPEALNAYTATMGAELADAFVQADADDAVRVIIVTGAGRGFCAGADMSAGADAFGVEGAKLFGAGRPTTGAPKGGFTEAIFTCRKPSIAAINGGAVGVGITMTVKRRAIGTPYRRPIGTLFDTRISGEARSHQHAQSVAAG